MTTQIRVKSPFVLAMTVDGKRVSTEFAAGLHYVEDAIAEHWYVKAHCAEAPDVLPRPGTPEFEARVAAVAKAAGDAERARLIAADVDRKSAMQRRAAETMARVHADADPASAAAVEAEAEATAAAEAEAKADAEAEAAARAASANKGGDGGKANNAKAR